MNKRQLILSGGLANIFEWYDYALFGHFAPIIGAKFFPAPDSKTSILQAFLVFAVGYLMRPLGGIFFGIIGDKFGRRLALSSAVICMAVPTAVVSVLPTYEQVGILAPGLMILARLLQGFSMGGTLTGSVSFLIEHTAKKHRGLVGSIPIVSICLGILLGSTVANIVQSNLPYEQFYSWGWRIPFLIGILVLFAGMYIKKYTTETPLFIAIQNSKAIVKSPLKTVLSVHWLDMLISIFINAPGSILFYLQTIYFISYLKINRGFNVSQVSNLATSCYLIMAIMTLSAGWLSDIVGRRQIMIIINLLIIIMIFTGIIDRLVIGNFGEVGFASIIVAILAALYVGAEPALQAELYPTNVRNTALSLSYNIATSLFGGTTPYLVEFFVQKSDNGDSLIFCIYYLTICTILSCLALSFYQDRSKLEL